MLLTEETAQAHLDALRQERDGLDRRIADLVLYLELGRRLSAAPGNPPSSAGASDAAQFPVTSTNTVPRSRSAEFVSPSAGAPPHLDAAAQESHGYSGFSHAQSVKPGDDLAASPQTYPANDAGSPASKRKGQGGAPTFASPQAGPAVPAIPGADARRRGREILSASLEILEDARRPLHASEILAALTTRGLSVPGRDPVAALNTRLWKRAMRGGALRRLGEAVYAIGEPVQR